jgi:hypothetical protein
MSKIILNEERALAALE